MKVLITNVWLHNYGGTEVYVRDLAFELKKRGIEVEVYSPVLGPVAHEILANGIPITDSVDNIINVPDIIHGHHAGPVRSVIEKFKGIPVAYFCHARFLEAENPLIHPQITKYVAVDHYVMDRLIENNIPEAQRLVICNWVDPEKFKIRYIRTDAKKALVFSNNATTEETNYYTAVKKACDHMSIELDTIGWGMLHPIRYPEHILGNYDIVFAKAKAAMESMAMGRAVILCDYGGLGSMVTSKNFNEYQKYNFGLKNLARPHDPDLIIEEIKKYDASDISKITRMIRSSNDFNTIVSEIINLYKTIIS